MRVAAAVIFTAMPEEAEPFLDKARSYHANIGTLHTPAGFKAWSIDLVSPRLILVQTGIGQTAAASAATWALEQVSTSELIMAGSAGGLHPAVSVGDVVIGSSYRYSMADARPFGYEYGQVPGQPAAFPGSPHVLEAATNIACEGTIHTGLILSSDCFVSADKVDEIRGHFPTGMAVDMESTAIAQVAASYGMNFTAIRAISDLCGPKAGEDHSLTLAETASRAAEVTLDLVFGLSKGGRSLERRRRSFGIESLTAALYAVVALDHDLEPIDASDLDLDLSDLHRDLHEDQITTFAGLIAAGKKKVESDPTIRLTSQRYDKVRSKLLSELSLEGGRGRQTWPPTSQTVMKRFDGLWNNALAAIGLRGSSGRKPGGLKYSDEDYVSAIKRYVDWAGDQKKRPSYAGYQAWLKAQATTYPSGASVRQHFGSWAEAVLSTYV